MKFLNVVVCIITFVCFMFVEVTYSPPLKEGMELDKKFNRAYQQVGSLYETTISHLNPKLTPQEIKDIARSIIYYTMFFNENEDIKIDPRLIIAIIYCESNFNPRSVSKKGAKGLGQIMPGTAIHFNAHPDALFHPQVNVYNTIKIFRNYLNRYRHLSHPYRIQFALAAYNAGPGAVEKYGGIPPFYETQNFIYKVNKFYYMLAPEEFRY